MLLNRMLHSQLEENTALKWSSTRKLTKTATGFVGTAKVPWNEKTLYKYIVDGNWALDYGTPVEVESRTGFVNHVYIAPPKPQVALPVSKPEPVIAEPVGMIVEPEDVDRDHVCRPDQSLLLPSISNFLDLFLFPQSTSPASGAIAAATPVTEEPANKPAEPVSPIAVDAHATAGEPVHADVGEAPIADAKSDSGTTAVADPEPTDITPSAPPNNECDPESAEKKMKGKPAALPSTTKPVVFPSVSPPSSPSRFGSLRGSGKKTRKPSFLAKLKEIFKSDKEKDKSGAETKT